MLQLRAKLQARPCQIVGSGLRHGLRAVQITAQNRSRSLACCGAPRNISKLTNGLTWTIMGFQSQKDLVDSLVRDDVLESPECIAAMEQVDRKDFLHPGHSGFGAYADVPVANGHGQTMSAPHMHAIALEHLKSKLEPGARVLDVGSGSGYLTACFAQMVMPGGYVLGVEKFSELVENSQAALKTSIPEWMASGMVQVRRGNVLGDLKSDGTRFDAIHVGAAPEEMPLPLRELLAPGGQMLIPIGKPRLTGPGSGQDLTLVTRAADPDTEPQFRHERLMNVAFVPLTKPDNTR